MKKTPQTTHHSSKSTKTKITQLSNQHFKEIVTFISDHIYVSKYTPQGRYHNVYISPQAQELTGYSINQLASNWQFWPKHIIHPKDQTYAAKYAQSHKHKKNYSIEYRIVRKDGKIRWVRDSVKIHSFKDKKSLYIYGLITDITQAKKTELELAKQTQNLEETITKRTQKLQKLVLTQKRFIADISHELRNPLALIKAIAETATDSNTPLTKSELITVIEKVDHIDHILRNLTLISKLDFDQLTLTKTAINLRDFLNKLTSQIQKTTQSPFNLTLNCPVNLTVHTDPSLLEAILTNLINNAITHATQKPTITLSTNKTSQTTSITIQDQNPPIPQEKHEHIFRRAYRDSTTKPGSGLGLYICQQLARHLNGTITLKTTASGNQFTLNLTTSENNTPEQ